MNKGWIGFLASLVLVGSAWAQRPDTIVIAQG